MRAVLLAAVIATGCQIKLDKDPTADAATDDGGVPTCIISTTAPTCLAAPAHQELSWLQTNVFTKNCALSNCHDGKTSLRQGQHPDLASGHSYAALVGATADLDSARTLVVPVDVNQSYLALLLGIVAPADAVPAGAKIPKEGLMPM